MKIKEINVSFVLENGTKTEGYLMGSHGEWQQWGGSMCELRSTQPLIESMNQAVLNSSY